MSRFKVYAYILILEITSALFFSLLFFSFFSNISMLEEMVWRKPSLRRALIWNLLNMLSAFTLNLQMPWSRNIYAPKPLKVRSTPMSGSVRFQSREWNHFAIRPMKTLCLRAVFYHHKTCLSCNKSTVCKKDQVVLKYAFSEKD